MNNASSLLLTFFLVAPAFAGDWLPTLPREVFCSPLGPEGKAFFQDGVKGLVVGDTDSEHRIRKAMSAKIAETYVAPAIAEACADRNMPGLQVVRAASEACATGCTDTLVEWPLRGQERIDTLEICKADCRTLTMSMFALGNGYDLGRKAKTR